MPTGKKLPVHSIQYVKELLAVTKEAGVSAFEMDGFKVRFKEDPIDVDAQIKKLREVTGGKGMPTDEEFEMMSSPVYPQWKAAQSKGKSA